MTTKISELRVTSTLDVGQYKAGMAEKVAADAAGTTSSQQLATATTQTYQKISQSGAVLDKLSKQYIEGYAATAKFEQAIRTLGRGVETGNVSLEQANVILDGVYKKFGLAASATSVEAAGFTKLATVIADHNAISKVGADAQVVLGAGVARTSEVVALNQLQWLELGHVARSTFGVLAAGGSVFQALTFEGSRIVSILTSGSGGVGGTLKAIGNVFTSILTPMRVFTAGIAALTIAATALGVSFANQQSRIALSLTGIGSAAGVTVDSINRIAAAVASAGELSVSDATDIATAIAATGKANSAIIGQVTALGHQVELVFGTDAKGAADILAKALEDPAAGVDTLNKRVAAYDDTTSQLVKTLAGQNNLTAAQQILVDGLKKSIGDATEQTTFWERAWRALSTTASAAINQVGKDVASVGGGPATQAGLDAARAKLAAMQTGQAAPGGRSIGLGQFADPNQIAAQAAEVDRLTKALADEAAKAAEAHDVNEAIDFGNIVRGIDPTFAKLNDLESTLKRVRSDLLNNAINGKVDDDTFAAAIHAVQTLESQISIKQKYIGLAQQQYGIESASLGQAIQENQIALQGIAARSPAQKADLAYQTTFNQLRQQGVGISEALIRSEMARTESLTQSQHDLSEAVRDRLYQNQQDVEQGQIQNDVIGRSIDVATRLTSQFQLLAAAKEEAFKNGTTVSAQEQLQALITADQKARQAVEAAQKGILTDINFSNAQLGRSSIDQAVYSRLQSAGLLDNGKIVGAQNEAIAAQVRFNEELERSIDIQKGFASDFLSDILQGKSATEALGTALDNLAQKILNNSLDTLFAGLKGAGAVSTGGLFGGNILPGILHTGGVVGSTVVPTRSVPLAAFSGAPRYHTGGVAGDSPFKPGEMPAILQKGEIVLPRGVSAGGGDIHVMVSIPIDARGADNAGLVALANEVSTLKAKLPNIIVDQVRNAKNRNMI